LLLFPVGPISLLSTRPVLISSVWAAKYFLIPISNKVPNSLSWSIVLKALPYVINNLVTYLGVILYMLPSCFKRNFDDVNEVIFLTLNISKCGFNFYYTGNRVC